MSSQFPAALDAFSNPTAADALNSAVVPHADQHANANDALAALQAKVGIDGSLESSSLDYRLGAVEAAAQIQMDRMGYELAGKPVTATSLATGDHLEFDGTQWVNMPKTTLVDGGNF